MNFLYFLPDAPAVTDQVMKRLGLGHLVSSGVTMAFIPNGPNGKSGTLFTSNQGVPARLAFKQDDQTWFDKKEYSIGFWNDSKPGPGELARDEQVGGHEVVLADGKKWLVPVARMFPKGSMLPEKIILNEDGSMTTQVLPEFLSICHDAEKVWSEFMEDTEKEDFELGPAEQAHIAARALGVNYRVELQEINALGLMTTQNMGKILSAMIDLPRLIEMSRAMGSQDKKKSEPRNVRDVEEGNDA